MYLRDMNSGYCIYRNKQVDDLSPEHIIPLSLGGCDGFCIDVDRMRNSQLGSAVDGKMANSYLMLDIRQKKGYSGHSGKPAKALIKRASFGDNGEPMQVHVDSLFAADAEGNINLLSTYSPKEKRELTHDETAGQHLRMSFTIDMTLEMAFAAKVLLAAGYFIFGDDFVRYTNHHALRNHIDWYTKGADVDTEENPDKSHDESGSCHRMILVLDAQNIPHPIPKELIGIYQSLASMCQIIGESCVLFHIRATQLIGTVGIGGLYIGTIAIKADVAKLAEKHQDIIVYVKDGRVVRTTHSELVASHNLEAGL